MACLNRDAHRSNRLPTMAVLNTFLGWDNIQAAPSIHPGLYPIPQPFVGNGQLLRLIGDATMALGVLHQHDIIHGDVVRNNLMLRADPPSFVLIDYGGSKETLWPATLGYEAKGQGGQRFRPPTEETAAPVMTTHGDFFRLARTIERDFCHPLEAGHRLGEVAGTARSRKRRQGGYGTGPLVLPSYMLQELHKWQDASSFLPICSHQAPGSNRPISLRSRATTRAALSLSRSTPPPSLRAPALGKTVRSPLA